MLSYRHAFHAGNHADVLKHFILLELLHYFNLKDKPWWYIDTHAGAGCYALGGDYADKNREYASGVERVWAAANLPEALCAYRDAVVHFNPDGQLALYPGSPALAMTQLREQDRMRLFELHPTDVDLLEQSFEAESKRVRIAQADGFDGLKSLLPPPTRRAVVLIDPSYELREDYTRVVKMLEEALRRFPTGVYALWYPILARSEARRLPEKLAKIKTSGWLDVQLIVRKPVADGFGMTGSGMFIINPPWTLPKTLNATLPWLVEALGVDEGATFRLNSRIE